MPFRDYYELADPLVLPIRAKNYEIPPAAADDIVRWRRFTDKMNEARESGVQISAEDVILTEDYLRMFLGTTLDEMRADGVHPGVIEHAASTSLTDTMAGRDAAERVWNSIDPKASSPATPPVAEMASTPSTSTDEATTTS
jgi:hypothetical protein